MRTIKQTILTVIFALFIGTIKLFSQTTQEEYNYITKGYKVQIESGLDMKKDYTLVDLGNWGLRTGNENRECTFKALMRQGQTKPCAIMMIYKRTDISNGVNWYICIPSPDSSELWDQTLDFINENFTDNNSLQKTIVWSLMKLSSQSITK